MITMLLSLLMIELNKNYLILGKILNGNIISPMTILIFAMICFKPLVNVCATMIGSGRDGVVWVRVCMLVGMFPAEFPKVLPLAPAW